MRTQKPDVMDLRNRLKVEDKENYMFLTLSPFIRKQFIEKIKVIKENYQKEFKSFEYLNNAMFLTDKYVELLNNFDYPFDVPKIVIKENVGDSFSEEGIEFLTLMNLLGVDIVILNPYGHNDINNRIELNEIILGNKKNEKRALLKDNVITSVLSTVIVFGLIFSSIFGMVSCYKIFISPYDKKEGELQESINLFNEIKKEVPHL